MTAIIITAIICATIWMIVKLSLHAAGVGPLAPGYTIAQSGDKLALLGPDGKRVMLSSYIDIYGYGACLRACVRASWFHHAAHSRQTQEVDA